MHAICTAGTRLAPLFSMSLPNIKMLGIVFLLTALPAAPATAGKANAVINGVSYHVNSTYDWNEENLGIGFEYEFGDDSSDTSKWKKIVMVNGFRDSNEEMSYMAGGGLHRQLFYTERLSGFYVQAGVNAFIMTRDDVNNNRPFLGALPSLTVGNRNLGFNLTYLPKQAVQSMADVKMVDPTMSGVLFMQFKISIDQLLP